MLPYSPISSIFLPTILLQIIFIPLPSLYANYSPYSQKHQNFPASHFSGHGPYKDILRNLSKPNARGHEENLVKLSGHHQSELEGIKGLLGETGQKIADLEYRVKDVEKELDDIQGNGNGNYNQNQSWQSQNGGGENLAHIERKLEEIQTRNVDLEEDLRRAEGNFRREIDSLRMGQGNQSTIRSELDRFRDEIERRMESRISQISQANSSQGYGAGGGNGRNADMDGMINRLARRVEQIETSSNSNRGLQNANQKYDQLSSNLQAEQRRLNNQIAQNNQQFNYQFNGIKSQLGTLEAKVANSMRNQQQQGGRNSGPQQIDRNVFEAMLRQSQELRRNMESVKSDVAKELNQKMQEQNNRMNQQNREILELKRTTANMPNLNNSSSNSSINPHDFRELIKSFNEIREEVRRGKNEDAVKFDAQLNEIKRMEQMFNQFEQRFGTHEAELSRHNAQRDQADNSMHSVNSGLAEMQRAQHGMEQRIAEWERRYAQLNGEFNEYKREFKNYQNGIDNQRNNQRGANNAVQNQDNYQTQQLINNRTRELNDKIIEVNRKIVQMDQTIQNMGAKMSSTQTVGRDQQKIVELNRKVDTMDRTIKNIQQQQNALPNRANNLHNNNNDLLQKFNQLSLKVDTIDRTVKNQTNLRGAGNANNISNNHLIEMERKYNELGQRIVPLERTVQTLFNHHNQQQISGTQNAGGQIPAHNLVQLKDRFDIFEKEINETFGWKMKNFTEMQQNFMEMQQNIRNMQAFEEQLNHKLQENLAKIQEMELKMGNFDEMSRKLEQIQIEISNGRTSSHPYGASSSSHQNLLMDQHQQNQQQQNIRIVEIEKRMDRLEITTKNELQNSRQNNNLLGPGTSTNVGVQKLEFDDLKREVQILKQNQGNQMRGGNLNLAGGQVQRMEFDDLRKDVQILKNNHNGNNALAFGGGTVQRMEFDDLRRDLQNIRAWKDENERKQLIGGSRSNFKPELSQNKIVQLEAMNLDQLAMDIRALNQIRPKLEQIDRIPEMNSEIVKMDAEMRRQKIEMENMERLKGDIGKLQEIEKEALKTLEAEFSRFNSIREIVRTVDFVQLDRDIKEFNANKYRLQSVEQEVKKFPDLDLKIRRIEQLEKDLGTMGNLRQISNRMDTLENRIVTLAGMGMTPNSPTTSLGQAEIVHNDLLLNKLKLLEDNFRKLDGLEVVPLQLRNNDIEKKQMQDRLKILEDFRDETHRFVLTEMREMSEVKEKMKKFDPLPDKVDTLEANARWQLERVQKADAFVNNFANLANELQRLNRLDNEWKKFDDVQKFVDRVVQLEILVQRHNAKMQTLDWLQAEWQKFGNLEAELTKLRAMEREMHKFGNIENFLRNVGQMHTDINSLKMQIGQHGNSAQMLTQFHAISAEMNNVKSASAQLKADFDHRLQAVDNAMQNWNRRILAVEKLDEEIKNVQQLVEPHRLRLTKLGQLWPQIESLDRLENSVKLLESAMTERTLRIHKLEQLLNGMDNLGAELQRIRKLENDLRMHGGFEQIQNRLQTLENKNRTIDVQQMAIDELNRGQKSMELKVRQFGDFDQFVAQTTAAQRDLTEITKKFNEFQVGMRNFDRLAADFRQIQQLEEELKKAHNLNGFVNRIIGLENSMEDNKKWIETKQNGIDEKVKILENDFSKSFYTVNKHIQTMLAQVNNLEHLPQKVTTLEYANLPTRTKTLEDKLDQLNLLHGQRGIGRNVGNENFIEISNKLKLFEDRMRQIEPMKMKQDEMEWTVKELEKKQKNLDIYGANSAHLQQNLHKLQTLEVELRKLDELKQIPSRLKLLEDEYQALYPLKLQMNNFKNLNDFLTRMTGIETEMQTQKTQTQFVIQSLTKNWDEMRLKVNQFEKILGKLKNLDDLQVQLFTINQFNEDAKKYGTLRDIATKIDGLQFQFNTLQTQNNQMPRTNAGQNLSEISQKMVEHNFRMEKQMKEFENFKKDWHQLYIVRKEMEDALNKFTLANQKLNEMQTQHDALKFNDVHGKLQKIEQIDRDMKNLQRNGVNANVNPLDPRQIEMQQKLAKLDLLERDVQNLNTLRLQMGRIQNLDLSKLDNMDAKLKEMDVIKSQLHQMGNLIQHLQRNGVNANVNPLDPRQIEMQQKLARLDLLERDVQNLNTLRLQMGRIQGLDLSKLDNLDVKLKEIETIQSQMHQMGNLLQHLQRNGAVNPLDPRQIEIQQKLVKLDLLERDMQNLNALRMQMGRIQSLDLSKLDNLDAKLKELDVIKSQLHQMGNLLQHLQRNGVNANVNPLDPRQIEMQQKLAKLDLLERDVQNLNSLRLQMTRIQNLAGDLSKMDHLDAKLKELEAFQIQMNRMGNSVQQLQKMQNMERELKQLEQNIVGIGGLKERADGLKQKIDFDIESRLRRLETLKPSVDSGNEKIRELEKTLNLLKFEFYRQNPGAQRTPPIHDNGNGRSSSPYEPSRRRM